MERAVGAALEQIDLVEHVVDAHPEGLGDTSCYPCLVAELLERDWSEAELALPTWGTVQRALRGADFTARAARGRRAASTATTE